MAPTAPPIAPVELQTQHAYTSSNSRVSLVVHTLPQRHLTLMGGSRERGRGAMTGVVHVEGDAKSVKLKITAKVITRVPRNGQNVTLDGVPSSTAHALSETELLSLTSELSGTLPGGSNQVPFTLDLPRLTADGKDLPPSYVLQAKSKSRKAKPEEWASVRYEARLVVERGLLRKKDNVVAPFAFISPPPPGPGAAEAVERAARVAAALKRGASSGDFREMQSWPRTALPGPKSVVAPDAPGLLSRMFGAKRTSIVQEETWELRLAPWPYPLRSGVPFAVQCTRKWSGAVGTKALELPAMQFLQTATLPGAAVHVTALVTFGLVDAPFKTITKGAGGAETETLSYLGLMPLPVTTSPSFVTLPLRVSHSMEVTSPHGPTTVLPLLVVAQQPAAVKMPPPGTRTAEPSSIGSAIRKAGGLPIHPHPSAIYEPVAPGAELGAPMQAQPVPPPPQALPYAPRVARPVAPLPQPVQPAYPPMPVSRPAPVQQPTPRPPAATSPQRNNRASYHPPSNSAAFPSSASFANGRPATGSMPIGRAPRQSLVASTSHAAAVQAAVVAENEKAARRRCASHNALAGTSRPVPTPPAPIAARLQPGPSAIERPLPFAPASAPVPAAAAAQAPPLPAKTAALPPAPAPAPPPLPAGVPPSHAAAIQAHAASHPGLEQALQHHFGPSTIAGGAIQHVTTFTTTTPPAASPAIGAPAAQHQSPVAADPPPPHAWEFADDIGAEDDVLPPSYFEVTGLPEDDD